MLVSTEWLQQRLQDADLVILCVSAKQELCSGEHIPGARWIPFNELVVTRDGIPNELPSPEQLQKLFEKAGVSNSSRVVLYGDRSGLSAARAYFTLDYLGMGDRVALLDGGFERWRAEKRPISTEQTRAEAGKLSLHINNSILITRPEMEKVVNDRRATLIDARPPLEFSGEKLSEEVSRAGHIPGARSVFWMGTLESATNPVLLPAARLRAIFEQAGAVPGRRVITYCRTGMQSSFDYFVAKYLGYDTAMYDGSFVEWSRYDLPVEKEHQPIAK